jgi:hypothetical protein
VDWAVWVLNSAILKAIRGCSAQPPARSPTEKKMDESIVRKLLIDDHTTS